MQKYEAYQTRRPPLTVSTGTMGPAVAAHARLDGIRDLMRMEMPDRWEDVSDPPYAFSWGSVPEPAVHKVYQSRYQPSGAPSPLPNGNYAEAKCLYLVLTTGNAEARAQFNQDEVMVDTDGFAMFKDGWGDPIYWLRWAPGCGANATNGFSEIQSGDPNKDHDPFDTQLLEPNSYHLIPLIYTGVLSTSGTASYTINTGGAGGASVDFKGDPYHAEISNPSIGTPVSGIPPVHNHHVE